jgi:hypothetical protein
MNRQTIEDKDRDVVKKFRSVVEGKELHKKRQKSRIKLLAGFAVVCSVGVLVFVNHYAGQKPSAVGEKETQLVDSANGSASAIPSALQAQQASTMIQAGALKTDTSDALIKKTSPKDLPPMVKSPQYSKDVKDIQNADLVKPENKKVAAKSSQKKPVTDGVQIAKVTACREVEDKRCESSQEQFSVKKDGKVCVWMDVRSKAIPHTLKHVYFVNGRRYRSIRLPIKYSQMRTWSGISLNGSQDVGKWRVDVVSEQGQTISHIEFTVVP